MYIRSQLFKQTGLLARRIVRGTHVKTNGSTLPLWHNLEFMGQTITERFETA